MKAPLIIIIVLSICLSQYSCSKKKDKDPNEFEVEYQIISVNNLMTKITYTDKNGVPVETDYNGFSGGSKKVRPNTKPFGAGIMVEINNTTNAPINFNLFIFVDGNIMAQKPCTAPAMALSAPSLQYIVQ